MYNHKLYFDHIRCTIGFKAPAYMEQDLFGLLVGARHKRSVTITEDTHMLMLEKNRVPLFREVSVSSKMPS
jgi:hypothetical protein